MSAHQAEFQERILRIKSGQAFTKATVYVGQETAFSYVPEHRGAGGGLKHSLTNAAYSASFPASVAVGFLCHVVERLAEFTMGGLPDPNANPDIEMAKVAVTGFLLTVVFSHLLGLRDRALLVPKLMGVAGGMLLFHNFVHLWPQLFEQIFSPIWVAHVLSHTDPRTLIWRGISFPF